MLEAPVVSAEFFRVLGAHPLLGRAITLDGKSHVVVGVMPAGFVFPISGSVPLITDL